jgi:hypothetical protein
LASLIPPEALAQLVAFILENGRGNVILNVKDRRVIGARIDAVLF